MTAINEIQLQKLNDDNCVKLDSHNNAVKKITL